MLTKYSTQISPFDKFSDKLNVPFETFPKQSFSHTYIHEPFLSTFKLNLSMFLDKALLSISRIMSEKTRFWLSFLDKLNMGFEAFPKIAVFTYIHEPFLSTFKPNLSVFLDKAPLSISRIMSVKSNFSISFFD